MSPLSHTVHRHIHLLPSSAWGIFTGALLALTLALGSVSSHEVMSPEPPNSKQAGKLAAQCENVTLNECWSQIPPFPDQGIPSSPESVTAACQAFNKGMNCVTTWTNRCLSEENRKKIMDSVRGAHEAYAFMCRDERFKHEFLLHSNCSKKISPHWDDCANKFIETLKSLSPVHYDNPKNLCCIRRKFKRCISEVSNYYCNKEASLFLLRMGETLVRSNMGGKTPKPETCDIQSMEAECDRNNRGVQLGNASNVFYLIASMILLAFERTVNGGVAYS